MRITLQRARILRSRDAAEGELVIVMRLQFDDDDDAFQWK